MLNKILRRLGYELKKHQQVVDPSEQFALYKYLKEDGSFDYEYYKSVQTQGNKDKLHSRWVQEENIEFLAKYLRSHSDDYSFGLCHGTRRGKEQEWFRKYLDCEVIGTEISDTATDFPHTIQWDFHEVKDEWRENTDFLYSNSFDHSFDPEMCLNQWMSCLKKGRFCILEHSYLDSPAGVSELDPFGVDLPTFVYLILQWGGGKYGVRELLKAPAQYVNLDITMIVIEKY